MVYKIAIILGDEDAGETVIGPFDTIELANAWYAANGDGLDYRLADMELMQMMELTP